MKKILFIACAILSISACAKKPQNSMTRVPALSQQQLSEQIARAQAGDVKMQYGLGMYYMSLKNDTDRTEGVKWIHIAAKNGLAVAQNDLGTMYANGMGVDKNMNEACNWWKIAADNGSQPALYSTAMCLGGGLGATADIPQSYAYLRVCKFLQECYFWDKRATSTIDMKISEFEKLFKENPQIEQRANELFIALKTKYDPLIAQQFSGR